DLDRLRAGGNRNAFLAKSEPVPGGFDYYLGEIEAGRIVSRTLADRLGAQVTESAKIVGRKLGVDIFRVTFLVRIRLFAPGDFATYGERVVEVMNLARGRAQAIDLATHQTTKMEEDELRRLGGAELLREAVLVSRTPSGIQVMDPVDFRTVDLVPPPGWAPEGEMVWVLRHEERLYIPRTTPPPSPPPKSPKRLK
ncbi:MAG TPA: NMD3-related protein, partial [Candidatus Thermoplasmatota archaeon]|nr:NMD3-related protein [Candidatus Thermoplasmatota archaeon]